MAHFIDHDGSIYVDTDFINNCRLPGMEVQHMGFGEFTLVTPEGQVEFDRMRGKDFEGQGGRSHKFYDREGYSNKLALKVVKEMEQHHKSEPAPGSKTASEKMSLRRVASVLAAHGQQHLAAEVASISLAIKSARS